MSQLELFLRYGRKGKRADVMDNVAAQIKVLEDK